MNHKQALRVVCASFMAHDVSGYAIVDQAVLWALRPNAAEGPLYGLWRVGYPETKVPQPKMAEEEK